MANKRILKKQVKYVCGDLAAECILAMKFIDGINENEMSNIIYKIAEIQTSTLQRVSFSYDKNAADFESAHTYAIARTKYFKQAYNTLKTDFNKNIQEIVKLMNTQLPQSQKDANKEALKQ